MREVTYGHYPPAQDIWTTYRNNPRDNYRKECLYNHYRSRYKDGENGTRTPETPIHAKHVTLTPRTPSPNKPSPTPNLYQVDTRSPKQTPSPSGKQTPVMSHSPTGKQTPVVWQKFSPSPPKKQRKPYSPIPVPVKAWSTSVPATAVSRPESMSPTARADPGTPDSYRLQVSQSQRPSRIQSATMRRHRESPKPRPVKSAGPSRSSAGSQPCNRPVAPEPMSPEPMADYDKELDTNGWKMEIPGDPLCMKKQCISRRLPYTVKCVPQKEARDPPKLHVENFDTYFYNTIPRKPMSFTIHQEWASEMLHAQRMELQKREGGVGYRYKNFSFVY